MFSHEITRHFIIGEFICHLIYNWHQFVANILKRLQEPRTRQAVTIHKLFQVYPKVFMEQLEVLLGRHWCGKDAFNIHQLRRVQAFNLLLQSFDIWPRWLEISESLQLIGCSRFPRGLLHLFLHLSEFLLQFIQR